ncbi:MAG: S8 family serine peptidase [Bacteroidetes bacterium]|nr:MAG: S8 family serine peptidase [Bacteroidota bacterium]
MMKYQRALWLLCFALFTVISTAQTNHPQQIDGEVYLKYKSEYPIAGLLVQTDAPYALLPGFDKEFSEKFQIYKAQASFGNADSKLKQTIRVSFRNAKDIGTLIKALTANPMVEYAEPVPLNVTGYTPNDLGTNTTTGQWGLYKIKGREAWDISKGDSAITVAVVDDGMNIFHNDLNNNVWRNPKEIAGNKIDDDNNGYVDDIFGFDVGDKDPDPFHPNTNFTHGTHVGGIAGAVSNNQLGVASIGYNISLMAVKCTFNAQSNTASIPMGYEGVTYAASAGADIINCSWSSGQQSQTAQNVIDFAVSKGSIVVAAASNDGVEQIRYPAAYDGVIAVASTDINDNKSSFSNYGTWVDVSAPGSRIRSTIATGSYSTFDGTSMATPMVAGLLGLMKSHNPNMTNAQLEQCLISRAEPIDALNQTFAGKIGSGRIDAEKSLQCAGAFLNAVPKAQIQSASTTACPNTVVSFFGSSTKGSAEKYTWYFPGGTPATDTTKNPVVTYTNVGDYDVALVITNTNGSDSINLTNYVSVSAYGNEVVFQENFESGNLTGMGFTTLNPDNGATWDVVNANALKGSKRSLRMNFFNYATIGQRDALISPVMSLNGIANSRLTMQHAYRARNTTKRDSLLVYVSTDSGQTFPYLVAAFAENNSFSFATQTASTATFTTTFSSDWCVETIKGTSCIDIDLSNFDGKDGIVFKLEAYNDNGNNLYIDNIKVAGNCARFNTKKPEADFANNDTTFCLPADVKFTDMSVNFGTSYEWIFEGGTPATSTLKNPQVNYSVSGTYDVTLIVGNSFGYDTIEMRDYIVAAANPVVTVWADTTKLCRGQSTRMYAAGAKDYFWYPVFAQNTTVGDTIIINPPSSFTYNVRGTSVDGCTDVKTISITVYPGPGTVNIFNNNMGSLYTNNNTLGVKYQWLLEGVVLPGDTSKTITPSPSAPGTYSLRASDSIGCKVVSNEYYFNPLSVINASDKGIKVYPNPASDVLYVETENGDAEIKVYNILGECVFEDKLIGKRAEITTKTLNDGIYFVNVQSGNQNIVWKVIINNE